MDIIDYFKKNGWGRRLRKKRSQKLIIDIDFINNEGKEDQTEFDLEDYNVNELRALYNNFCRENNFPNNTVIKITVVRVE